MILPLYRKTHKINTIFIEIIQVPIGKNYTTINENEFSIETNINYLQKLANKSIYTILYRNTMKSIIKNNIFGLHIIKIILYQETR